MRWISWFVGFFVAGAVAALASTPIPVIDLGPQYDKKTVTVAGTVVEVELDPDGAWANFEVCDGTARVHVYWLFPLSPGKPRTRPAWFTEGVEVQISGVYWVSHEKHSWEPEIVADSVRELPRHETPVYVEDRQRDSWSITFYGAAGEVAGSCYLVAGPTARILVDCGSWITSEVEGSETTTMTRCDHAPFEFNPTSIDAVLITHAQDDHTGRLHYLFDQGFRGTVFMTHPTWKIYDAKLSDTLNDSCILKSQRDGIKEAIRESISCHHYAEEFEVVPGVRAMFVNAGHIPGSASIVLRLQNGEQWITATFSGDIGPGDHPFLSPPDLDALSTTGTEVLILESTYGAGRAEASGTMEDFFSAISTAKDAGKLVIIPTFALDRTQRLLAALVSGKDSGALPQGLKIAVGGASSQYFTDAYIEMQNEPSFSRWFSPEFVEKRPLSLDKWEYPQFDIQKQPSSARQFDVIVTPSGSGASSDATPLLREFVGSDDVLILKVGWAPKGSPMRQLADGATFVTIDGQAYPVQADFHEFHDLFSGHADPNGLLSYVRAFPDLRTVVLTHGENRARNALRDAIRKDFPHLEVVLPGHGTTVPVCGP